MAGAQHGFQFAIGALPILDAVRRSGAQSLAEIASALTIAECDRQLAAHGIDLPFEIWRQ